MYYDDEEYYYKRRRARKKLTRRAHGLIFGVCEGISDYTGINVGLIRFIMVLSFILSGFAPIGIIYLLLAVFLPVSY